VASILKRLRIDGSMWIDLVWKFKKYYQGSAAGMPDSLARDASAHQHRWRRGQRAVRRIFASAGWLDEPRPSLCQPVGLRKPKPGAWSPVAICPIHNVFAGNAMRGWHALCFLACGYGLNEISSPAATESGCPSPAAAG
jgi:hypothetical protein